MHWVELIGTEERMESLQGDLDNMKHQVDDDIIFVGNSKLIPRFEVSNVAHVYHSF